MRKLTIVFHDAGGGHRSAAEAIRSVLVRQDLPWDVELLNLQQLLESLDLARRLTGFRFQDAYNQILRKGWTRLTPQLLVIFQTIIRLYHHSIVKALRKHWHEHPADLVLSVIPHFNLALAESIEAPDARPLFVTLITDLADYPPHFWIERKSEYIIAGTERARQQAFQYGHSSDHVFLTSGMVLRPSFYQAAALGVGIERSRLDLDPEIPTGIVLFGGHGSKTMLDIVKDLDDTDVKLQLILLCGHNLELADKLRNLQTKNRLLVKGFTPHIEFFMALSDFFIGKPGPGSISEALQMKLPVVVECNSRTLPQERYNAEWVAENGYGMVISNFSEIGPCVQRLLEPTTFQQYRRRVATYSNRALLEVPQILDRCWNESWEAVRTAIPPQVTESALARA